MKTPRLCVKVRLAAWLRNQFLVVSSAVARVFGRSSEVLRSFSADLFTFPHYLVIP